MEIFWELFWFFNILDSIVIFICEFGILENILEFYSPFKIYKMSKLNWIGCITLSVCRFCISFPLGMICFIYWVFHVGRKAKN